MTANQGLPQLFARRLLVVTGKGGVGRTTVACALAVSAARLGLKVLLAQAKTGNRAHLGELLGAPGPFDEVRRVQDNLFAVTMTPEAALREYGTMILHSAFVYKQVFERDVVRAFLRAVPGLLDYSMLGKVWYHTTEEVRGRPRYDLVVFDAPATGHSITMLKIPSVILGTVPEGPLTGPARACQALLTDPARCLALLVTLAEDLPVSETLQLSRGLAELKISRGPVVINRVYSPWFNSGTNLLALSDCLAAPEAHQDLAPLLSAAQLARERNELNERYLAYLAEHLDAPQIRLPHLFTREFQRAAIDDLADRLSGQIM